MIDEKYYSGTAYIGVVGPENEIGACRDSIHRLKIRQGDALPAFNRATKGYEARQIHINRFLESDHDFILLLDSDMVFAPDTLERMRTHGRPYVTGAYMRRTMNPIAPVWFKDNPDLKWPYEPETAVLSKDRLHPVGASGWGCILIHREVITAVRGLLKGEPEVIEDDMDIWPYDLERVMGAVNRLKAWQETGYGPDARCDQYNALNELLSEIRPLRGTKDSVGSDIRFPFFARVAGYQLWLDPSVRPGHMLNYPLTADDYDGLPPEIIGRSEIKGALVEGVSKGVREDRAKMEGVYNALVNMPVSPNGNEVVKVEVVE